MHWFNGTIAQAVALSKQRNAIFVVFIHDDNPLSKELAESLEDKAVLKRLSDINNFFAVKLRSGSEYYTYFAQIYQFVPVPSLFFIGRSGIPLEVVCGGVNTEQLVTRIDRILEEHRKDQKPRPFQPSTSSHNMKEETANFMQAESASLASQSQPIPVENNPEIAASVPQTTGSVPQPTLDEKDVEPETSSGPAAKVQKTEHHEVTSSGQEYEVVCDGDVCVRRPKEDQAGPSQRTPPSTPEAAPVAQTENSPPIDAKVERAQELLNARKKEKEEKEKELEKQKEMERRAVGQGVAELKRWQADQEMKQIQDDRKREKMENNLARQRILEQIALDRAERKAREQPLAAPPAAPTQVTPPSSVGDNSGRARVQFKLPDGSAHTAHFAVTATLADVQRYVADNLRMTRSSFSLWTAFPRRQLVEVGATLQDLQLVPSAALLVLPRRSETIPATPHLFATIITLFTQFFTSMILDPSYQLYTWLCYRLFPGPPNPTPPSNPTPARPAPEPVNTAGLRRRDNVHRVTADRPDDDDNNTWNGNSTQQM